MVEDPGDPGPRGRPQRADTVLVELRGVPSGATTRGMTGDGRVADPSQALLWQLLDGAGTRGCLGPSLSDQEPGQLDRRVSARLVAAAWLLGRTPPGPAQTTASPGDRKQAVPALAARTLSTLRSLPAEEQRARVAALRQAELTCDRRDLLDILVGPAGHR